jgi:hypothetical protein
MIRVFTMFPAIPTVPFRTLVTDVKNDQLTADTPFIITYTMIRRSNRTENAEHT